MFDLCLRFEHWFCSIQSFIRNNNESLCCSNPNSDSHPGVNPYPGIQVDQSFYKLIQNGFKMEQPYYSTESV